MSIIDWARANAESNRRKKYAEYLAHKRPAPGKCLSGEQLDKIAAEARWGLEDGLSVEDATEAALEFFGDWLWSTTPEARAQRRAEAHAAIQDHFNMVKDWPQYRKYFK